MNSWGYREEWGGACGSEGLTVALEREDSCGKNLI